MRVYLEIVTVSGFVLNKVMKFKDRYMYYLWLRKPHKFKEMKATLSVIVIEGNSSLKHSTWIPVSLNYRSRLKNRLGNWMYSELKKQILSPFDGWSNSNSPNLFHFIRLVDHRLEWQKCKRQRRYHLFRQNPLTLVRIRVSFTYYDLPSVLIGNL